MLSALGVPSRQLHPLLLGPNYFGSLRWVVCAHVARTQDVAVCSIFDRRPFFGQALFVKQMKARDSGCFWLLVDLAYLQNVLGLDWLVLAFVQDGSSRGFVVWNLRLGLRPEKL